MSKSRIAQWASRWSSPIIDASSTPSNIPTGLVEHADRLRTRLLTLLGIVGSLFIAYNLVATIVSLTIDTGKTGQLLNFIAGAIYFAGIGLTVAYLVTNQRHPYTLLPRDQAVARQRIFAAAWWWYAGSLIVTVVCVPLLIVAVLISIALPDGVVFIATGWVVVLASAVMNAWLLRRIFLTHRQVVTDEATDSAPDKLRVARIFTMSSLVVALIGALPLFVVILHLGIA